MKKNIAISLKNTPIAKYTKQPVFLTKKDKEEFIELLQKKKYEKFYELGIQKIKSSSDVRNLYIYLQAEFDKNNLKSPFLEKKVRSILKEQETGFLGIKDPNIQYYLGKRVDDKKIKFYNKYTKHLKTEEMLAYSINIDEKLVEDYLEFLKKSLDEKQITTTKYEEVLKNVKDCILIKKSSQILGSLISEKLQEKLELKTIYPKVKINVI